MASTWVLKLPQVDSPNQPVLVHVTQKQGTKADLDLLATDGEDAYRGKVKQRHLARLQSKNFDGTEDEWSELLQYALVSKPLSQTKRHLNQNLEVDCTISGRGSKSTMSITLRNRIEDITQTLGAIELSYSDNTDDIDLFGWACQLADQRDKLEAQASSRQQEADSTKDRINSLEMQLNDLVKAKEEHEEQLLARFAALLNTKKAKIRNQQRVLQTANVSKKKRDEMRLAMDGTHSTTMTAKRKRGESKAYTADEDNESDGFEAMDVDKPSADQSQDEAQSGRETPARPASAETETASEDEDAAPPESRDIAPVTRSTAAGRSPTPPPRELPFQKKGQNGGQARKTEPPPSSAMDEDASTESEDDEL